MDKLRAAVATATEWAARSRPATTLRAFFDGARARERHQQGQGRDQQGHGLAEYALILAGIAIVAIASLVFLGGTIADLFWAPINEDFAAVLSRLGI
ncbi:MAG: hypothetical protein PVG27_03125 [Chloroflexota bacterium]|jgi:Flp pilus assembly pilin Flp